MTLGDDAVVGQILYLQKSPTFAIFAKNRQYSAHRDSSRLENHKLRHELGIDARCLATSSTLPGDIAQKATVSE
jgi:hypothetical protein